MRHISSTMYEKLKLRNIYIVQYFQRDMLSKYFLLYSKSYMMDV